VSATERCQTLAMNLERARWMPQTLPDRSFA
jgi:murein L,D-transpeptidase YcbB/YkuD